MENLNQPPHLLRLVLLRPPAPPAVGSAAQPTVGSVQSPRRAGSRGPLPGAPPPAAPRGGPCTPPRWRVAQPRSSAPGSTVGRGRGGSLGGGNNTLDETYKSRYSVVPAQPHLGRHLYRSSVYHLYLLARLQVDCADQPAPGFLPALPPHHHLRLPRLAVILLQQLVHLHTA